MTVLQILCHNLILLLLLLLLKLLLLPQRNPAKHLCLVVQLFLHCYRSLSSKRSMSMNTILWRRKCCWSDFTLTRAMQSEKCTGSNGISCRKIARKSRIFSSITVIISIPKHADIEKYPPIISEKTKRNCVG